VWVLGRERGSWVRAERRKGQGEGEAGKDRARYDELVGQDLQRRALDKKLDDYMITSLSGFEGASLEEFKKFCSFHPSYIIQAETLDIFFEVLRCKEEYVEQEGLEDQ
jgi:hypothetical protein